MLVPHPSTPAPAYRVTARVQRAADGLRLRYRLAGALGAVRVAPPGPPRGGDRLWEHTCFEAFVGPATAPAYVELNLAPSGEWAAYAFRDYRHGSDAADAAVTRLEVRSTVDVLELDATVRLGSTAWRELRLRLGLSAVVEAADGHRAYWALRHPAGPPDFHHADAFALALEPAAGTCEERSS